MFFFIDETWQSAKRGDEKVGVLTAVSIDSHDFNDCSREIGNLKAKHLGSKCRDIELKGQELFKRYYFRLEWRGIKSHQLELARDVFSYAEGHGLTVFASVVMDRTELDLSCANERQLERPFFFLFERINLFMEEHHPELVAKLVFDDRGNQLNERISKSVSNFFHKSHVGLSFDRILKVPFFAISTENVGIQLADLIGHVIGRRHVGDERAIGEFFSRIKRLEYKSKKQIEIEPGRKIHLLGIKVARDKKKEAGDLDERERSSKPIV